MIFGPTCFRRTHRALRRRTVRSRASPDLALCLRRSASSGRRARDGSGRHGRVLLILLLLGTVPSWPYSAQWGYGPSGVILAVLLVLMLLLLTGSVRFR